MAAATSYRPFSVDEQRGAHRAQGWLIGIAASTLLWMFIGSCLFAMVRAFS